VRRPSDAHLVEALAGVLKLQILLTISQISFNKLQVSFLQLTGTVVPFNIGFWSSVGAGANTLAGSLGFNLMYAQVPC